MACHVTQVIDLDSQDVDRSVKEITDIQIQYLNNAHFNMHLNKRKSVKLF